MIIIKLCQSVFSTNLQLLVLHQRLCLNGSSGQEVVIRKDLQNVEALTFDPISRLLYWVDAGAQKIEVLDMCKSLYSCFSVTFYTTSSAGWSVWNPKTELSLGSVSEGFQSRRGSSSHVAQLLGPGTSQSSGAAAWWEVSTPFLPSLKTTKSRKSENKIH